MLNVTTVDSITFAVETNKFNYTFKIGDTYTCREGRKRTGQAVKVYGYDAVDKMVKVLRPNSNRPSSVQLTTFILHYDVPRTAKVKPEPVREPRATSDRWKDGVATVNTKLTDDELALVSLIAEKNGKHFHAVCCDALHLGLKSLQIAF